MFNVNKTNYDAASERREAALVAYELASVAYLTARTAFEAAEATKAVASTALYDAKDYYEAACIDFQKRADLRLLQPLRHKKV